MSAIRQLVFASFLLLGLGVMPARLAGGGTRDASRLHTGHVGTVLARPEGGRAETRRPVLKYRVRLSGSDYDGAAAIAIDPAGNAYVTGTTRSRDFPIPRPRRSRLMGGEDAFVVELNPAGKVVYGTYLGGSSDDEGTGIAVDSHGDAWVTGVTRSSNYPTTPDAFQPHLDRGTCRDMKGLSAIKAMPCTDAFLTELDPAGRLVYSTFLGGSRDDEANGIALDPLGYIYLAGWTQSSDFPTASPLQSTLNTGKPRPVCLNPLSYQNYIAVPTSPCPDTFVTKLTPGGRQLLYSTYVGGRGDDEASSIAVDGRGNAYVAGWTNSPDFPLVHPLQRALHKLCTQRPDGPRCSDAFVFELSPDSTELRYGTLLGGNGIDQANGIAVDGKGNAYVVGLTTSSNFPAVHPVERTHPKGRCGMAYPGPRTRCPDMFVARLAADGSHLVYSSRVGGFSLDGANAVAVDSRDDAYVVGYAGSYNFPILHPLRKRSGGGFDLAIFELTPAGNRAYYSTTMGGQGDDSANGVAAGRPGTVYIAGELSSINYSKPGQDRGGDVLVLKVVTGALESASLPCRPLPGYTTGGCGQKHLW